MRTFARIQDGWNGKDAAVILILAAIYFGASKFGFMMAFTAKQVSAVWPPTGIALAAVLIFGPRVWPGIALGAFLANYTTFEPMPSASFIAVGNTLEAVTGAWLLRHIAHFDSTLSRMKDIRGLLLFSAILSTTISATFGVTSLCLSGVQPWQAYWSLWLLWWVGDATGAIIVAPLLLAWSRKTQWPKARDLIEFTILFLGLAAASLAVFSKMSLLGMKLHNFFYLIFVFVIWAAIRFGQRGTTLVTLVTSCIAIGAALRSSEIFAGIPADQNFAALQIFMAVIAMTGLFLSAAVAEREQAEKALHEANRNKDEFLSMLAHELRNPLASIAGALHIIRLPAVSAEQHSRALSIMDRQLQQIIRLIEDLVDVARISHGKIELRRAPVALDETIAIATETVAPIMEANGHEFSSTLPEQKIWLDADPARLAQIFINLLNNAAKYTPPGGRITLTVESDGQTMTAHVRDNGIGIASDMLPKVFDMFTQIQNSAVRSTGGLGIGLTLVRRLVEMHGGGVEAHSAGAGQGSEFIVRLPQISAPSAAASQRKDRIVAEPQKFRIMVADDNESFAETFSCMLRLQGHDVRVAHDGGTALDLAKSFLPDVALLDIGLPEINGYDLCKEIRAMPALSHAVLIAQTGYGQTEHRERSRAVGFDHHLVKPVQFDTIKALLDSLKTGASNDPEEERPFAKTG